METLYIEHGGTAMRMREIRRAAEQAARPIRARRERRYLRELSTQISARMPLPAGAGEALAQLARARRCAAPCSPAAWRRSGCGSASPRQRQLEGKGVRTALVLDPGGAGRGG